MKLDFTKSVDEQISELKKEYESELKAHGIGGTALTTANIEYWIQWIRILNTKKYKKTIKKFEKLAGEWPHD